MEIIIEKVNLTNPFEVEEIKEFLEKFDLKYEQGIDYGIVARREGVVVGTCSKEKNILKCFAIEDSVQGEGLTNKMIKYLQDRLFEKGIYNSFIFTKPEYSKTFNTLGYEEVERSNGVVLLEGGFGGIKKSLEKIKKTYKLDDSIPKTALVMNCNPFTLGHRYLIEEASLKSKEVLIFVVEEEKSLFPFNVRYNLLKKGVEDLENVRVIPGGDYIISSATFPGYFLKEKDEKLREHTSLDAKIFGRYFCEYFNINKRMVGDEPYCEVTRLYNETLVEILKGYRVEVEIVGRKKDDGKAISASRVRDSIKNNKGIALEELEGIIPKVTLDYLMSDNGKEIIKKIIVNKGRH